MIAALELSEGFVARFDPHVLLLHGAEPNGRPTLAEAGSHYFICLGRFATSSVWTPAFSRERLGRIRVGWKGGWADWVAQASYVDLTQLWIVPDDAIAPASRNVDLTQRGIRNHASLSFLIPTEARHQAV